MRTDNPIHVWRVGGYYESTGDDAARLSKLLGLTLTQTAGGVPLCGFPFMRSLEFIAQAHRLGTPIVVAEYRNADLGV